MALIVPDLEWYDWPMSGKTASLEAVFTAHCGDLCPAGNLSLVKGDYAA